MYDCITDPPDFYGIYGGNITEGVVNVGSGHVCHRALHTLAHTGPGECLAIPGIHVGQFLIVQHALLWGLFQWGWPAKLRIVDCHVGSDLVKRDRITSVDPRECHPER